MSDETTEATEAEAAETEELDLRGLISKTVDDNIASQEEAEEGGEEDPEDPDEEEQSEDDGAEAEEEAGDKDEDEEEEAEQEDGDDGEAEPPVEAPAHWSAEDKEIYASLPREQQEWWVNKAKSVDNNHSRRMEELADIRREHATLTEALKPVEGIMTQLGLDRPTAVRTLVGAQVQLMNDPGGALEVLAGQYGRSNPQEVVARVARAVGLDLSMLSGETAEGDIDPNYAQPINYLNQRIATLENSLTQQQQQAQEAAQNEAQSILTAFAEAKDESGALKHPHFEKVRPVMSALLNSGQAVDLDSAYEQACGADPDLREAMFKARIEKSAKERETSRKKSVKKAKAASRNVKGDKVPGSDTPKAPATHRGAIEAALEEQGA